MDIEKARNFRAQMKVFSIVGGIAMAGIVFYALHTFTGLGMTAKLGLAFIAGVVDWATLSWLTKAMLKNTNVDK